MLPEEIRKDNRLHEYRVMRQGETDIRHCSELWERLPAEQDIPIVKDENGNVTQPGQYFGEWVDCTERAKAEWEAVLAENELIRLRQEAIATMRLDNPSTEVRKATGQTFRGTRIC